MHPYAVKDVKQFIKENAIYLNKDNQSIERLEASIKLLKDCSWIASHDMYWHNLNIHNKEKHSEAINSLPVFDSIDLLLEKIQQNSQLKKVIMDGLFK